MAAHQSIPSYYADTQSDRRGFARLEGHSETDTVIVGGGFAGVNTALSLIERGHREVVLLEAETIGFGASGRNGGFVFAGYSLGEGELIAALGADRARALYQRTVAAVGKVRERIRDHAIDCDPVDQGVIWANWFRDPAVLRNRQDLLAREFDIHWQWIARDELQNLLHTERYGDALLETNALHLHPLNYVTGLARSVEQGGGVVNQQSRVVELRKRGSEWLVRTQHGSVAARRVVLACGGYLAGLQHRIDRAILPIASYVMVTEPLRHRLGESVAARQAIYDTRFAFDYYRALPDTRLLWGGRISVRRASPETVTRLLRRDLARVYPQLAGVRIDYAWSGLMSYARHQMPQIGSSGDGLWWAQAFGGHGLAPTTVAGELLGAAIAEGDEAWRELEEFGLDSAWRPFGYLAAQAAYWRAQWADWRKATAERHP